MSDVLTVSAREASQRLGIGLTTTYRLLKTGALRSIRVGRRPNFRVPIKVLEEVLDAPERLSLSSWEEPDSG
jgi:excisionase family DNA binding protein